MPKGKHFTDGAHVMHCTPHGSVPLPGQDVSSGRGDEEDADDEDTDIEHQTSIDEQHSGRKTSTRLHRQQEKANKAASEGDLVVYRHFVADSDAVRVVCQLFDCRLFDCRVKPTSTDLITALIVEA